jgi:carbon-monoxide dehydrogenase large subunit
VAGSILGTRVQRKEDPKFLTTGGVYVDDLHDELLNGALHVVYARSAVAHGTILSIDVEGAKEMPGVVGVFTAESLGLEPVPSQFNPMVARTLLASDKVRFVGEPVVAVVAETQAQAADAADLVFVDVDFLPALIDIEASMASETLIYEGAGSNAVFDTTVLGMPENTDTDEFFKDCEVVVTGRFLNSVSLRVRWRFAGRLRRGSTDDSTSGSRPSTRRASRRRSPRPMASIRTGSG